MARAGFRPIGPIEVADVLRRHGDAYRLAHAGHLGRVERRVMSAIVACRTAALGGHVEACDDCGVARDRLQLLPQPALSEVSGTRRGRNGWPHARPNCCRFPISTSCSHCPRRSPPSRSRTRPSSTRSCSRRGRSDDDAGRQPAQARRTDRRRRGSAHMGADADASSTRPLRRARRRSLAPMARAGSPGGANFFLAVKPLARLFRRLFLERLQSAFDARRPRLLRRSRTSGRSRCVRRHLAAVRRVDWIVYAKKPFGGPAQVLAYLGRYTHRVAIANSRIQDCDDDHVAFTWKDYRDGGAVKTMCLKPDEFIRRFLLHALPDGFHRIRHFGFLANGHRTQKLALCRSLLTDTGEPTTRGKKESPTSAPGETVDFDPPPCPQCGGVMRVIADLPAAARRPRSERPPFWCDTS